MSNDGGADAKIKMDKRCPRKLEHQPESWCPLAVLRLKALRNAGKELTEEEEEKLPGCPWAVNHQLANYCFFNYLSNYLHEDTPPSHVEIAHMLNISIDTSKKVERDAIDKGRQQSAFKELIDSGDSGIMSDSSEFDSYKIVK